MFRCSLGCVHEGDGGVHFDVLPYEHFLLERALLLRSPAPARLSCKRPEEILEIDVRPKALRTSTETPESGSKRVAWPAGCSARRVKPTAGATLLIECRGAVLIVGCLFLGVGQDFVGGLGVGEFVFGGGVFVRVWVVFFREGVVGFFDVGRGGGFGDAEGGVGVFGCLRGGGWVEVLD